MDSVNFGLGGDLVLGERAANCGGKRGSSNVHISQTSRLCEIECEWPSSVVKGVTFNVMSQKSTVLDASAMRCMASAMSVVVAELQRDEQACHESMRGELSYSLSGVRKELHNCDEKWRQVFINHQPESSALVRHRERELCGFTHDRYTTESDSVQLMCIESRLEEGLTFAQRVDLGVVDGNDLMVTIMNRMAIDRMARLSVGIGSSRDVLRHGVCSNVWRFHAGAWRHHDGKPTAIALVAHSPRRALCVGRRVCAAWAMPSRSSEQAVEGISMFSGREEHAW